MILITVGLFLLASAQARFAALEADQCSDVAPGKNPRTDHCPYHIDISKVSKCGSMCYTSIQLVLVV